MPTALTRRVALTADTAADLMSPVVCPLSYTASFSEAVAHFVDQNVNVAPVVGDHGEPVGVLSLTDLLVHVRECAATDRIAPATAGDLMTPTLFAVAPDTPAADVIADMIRSQVHHLFVTDAGGIIRGMVSACDVLRHLR